MNFANNFNLIEALTVYCTGYVMLERPESLIQKFTGFKTTSGIPQGLCLLERDQQENQKKHSEWDLRNKQLRSYSSQNTLCTSLSLIQIQFKGVRTREILERGHGAEPEDHLKIKILCRYSKYN